MDNISRNNFGTSCRMTILTLSLKFTQINMHKWRFEKCACNTINYYMYKQQRHMNIKVIFFMPPYVMQWSGFYGAVRPSLRSRHPLLHRPEDCGGRAVSSCRQAEQHVIILLKLITELSSNINLRLTNVIRWKASARTQMTNYVEALLRCK